MLTNFYVLFSTILLCNGFHFPRLTPLLFPNFEDFGRNIHGHMKQSLESMNKLGEEIKDDIEAKMLPLKRMQMMTSLSNGVGGSTIAHYSTGQTRLIKNGIIYNCIGYIVSTSPPHCEGRLEEFEGLKFLSDICYSKNYAQIGDHLCIADNKDSVLKFSYMNEHYQCYESDGSRAVLVSFQQFKNICGGGLPSDTIYVYYPDSNSEFAVSLDSPYVACIEKEDDSCTFKLHNGASIAFGNAENVPVSHLL